VCFFLVFSTTEIYLILSRTQREMIINVYRSSCAVLVILVGFERSLYFGDRFSKATHVSNFMKIRPLDAELFLADGRTDITKLIFAFRSFANAFKNQSVNAVQGNNRCLF
jgi:hypothetical protein